jgi:hypothetical protein
MLNELDKHEEGKRAYHVPPQKTVKNQTGHKKAKIEDPPYDFL